MPSDEKRPLQNPGGDVPDEIRALFKTCEQRQKALRHDSLDKVCEVLIQELSFARSEFSRGPEERVSPEDALSWSGICIRCWSSSLKAAPNDDSLWYWLAQWLKSEDIREPDRFPPKDIYRELTKSARQRLTGLVAHVYNSSLIKIWLPYTEPLLRKAKWLRQRKPPCDVKGVLRGPGYNPKVLNVLERTGPFRNWRSAVEFTCAWVDQKGGSADADTLRNAYSRVFGKQFLRQKPCSFCDQPAENEFWAYGDPVPHCKEHGADQLPTSESSALADRTGRRWWREDLNLRCTISAASL